MGLAEPEKGGEEGKNRKEGLAEGSGSRGDQVGGDKVQASLKLLCTTEEPGSQHPSLLGITRPSRVTQASCSRLLKKSRSCWLHRRLCR